YELARSSPNHKFPRARREALVNHILQRRRLTNQRVEHHHIVPAGGIEELLDVRHCRYAARSGAAIRLHQVEDQKRRRFGVDVHRLELGYWRWLYCRPFGGDVVGLYGPRGKRGNDGEECG